MGCLLDVLHETEIDAIFIEFVGLGITGQNQEAPWSKLELLADRAKILFGLYVADVR